MLPWSIVNATKVRNQLETLLKDLKGSDSFLPSRLLLRHSPCAELPLDTQSFLPFQNCLDRVRYYLDCNPLVKDLREASIRPRHWKQLQVPHSHDHRTLSLPSHVKNQLHTSWKVDSLLLGEFWDSEPTKHREVWSGIITQCQGELALEEFLKKSRICWSEFEIELIPYQDKCSLINDWTTYVSFSLSLTSYPVVISHYPRLFAKLNEDVNSLTHMKHSPFFAAFADQAAVLEGKLMAALEIFTIWSEVLSFSPSFSSHD